VNLAGRTPATHAVIVRHYDRPGVLATVLDAFRNANINVQEMENVVFEGAQAAVAKINVDRAPDRATLDDLAKQNSDIIEVSLIELTAG
jgi:D-3-phosphoglycerate dehydrogenase